MTDVHSTQTRAKNMSAIKSKGNKSTEIAVLELFRSNRIQGWRRHSKKVYGTPDFSFSSKKLAVFIDGCFWHRCPTCFKLPKSNTEFWENKIANNVKRDHIVNKMLAGRNWEIIRIWEHEIKKCPQDVLSKIIHAVSK